MQLEINWDHEKIQEFLNDEDFVFFVKEVEELQKQKLNDDEIKNFCKTIKEKRIKKLLENEEVHFTEFIDFLEEENLSIKNVFESKKLAGFDLRSFIDYENYYFIYEKEIYRKDYYIIAEDTGIPVYRDHAYYCASCDTFNQYETEKVRILKDRRQREEHWCEECVKKYASEYQDEYYSTDQDTLDYYNLELIDGELYEWPEEEEEDGSDYIAPYGSGGDPINVNFSENPKFFIGYEIEKEDQEIKESIYLRNFEKKCEGWRKEKDGSLNKCSGYELISPIFELNAAKIKEEIEKNQILVDHINAEKSNACGGHINISEKDKTGQELFECLKGYTPLFYALYHKRIGGNYCKAKKNKDLQQDGEKYQAIRIHDNRLEYRIISAVPSLKVLIWRTRLFEFILNNQTPCVKEAFFNINKSPLKDLLKEVYKSSDKFEKLINRVVKYTLEYEETELSQERNK